MKKNVGWAVLEQLRQDCLKGRVPRTTRELAEIVGASQTAVRNNLRVMERHGRVRRAGAKPEGTTWAAVIVEGVL